jgi:hypothetical protein
MRGGADLLEAGLRRTPSPPSTNKKVPFLRTMAESFGLAPSDGEKIESGAYRILPRQVDALPRLVCGLPVQRADKAKLVRCWESNISARR